MIRKLLVPVILLAAIIPTLAQAQTMTPPSSSSDVQTAPPSFDCERFLETTSDFDLGYIVKRYEHNDYSLADDPKKEREQDRNELAALIAECYYAHGDYPNAAKYYNSLGPTWYSDDELGNHLLNNAYAVGAIDADKQSTILPYEEVYRHAALSFEKIGQVEAAKKAIRIAYKLMTAREYAEPDQKVIADYERIDADNIAKAKAAAEAQRKRNAALQRIAQAKAKKEAQAEEKRENAAFRARLLSFANGYRGDRRIVALRNGIPCRSSTSSNTLGNFETWYYGCDEDNSVGGESFTFRNGVLVDHSTW
jgi:hypothetical protein